MGKLILRNNGFETQFINGLSFSGLSAQTNTYFLGFDPFTNNLEGLDPSGNTINFEGGGTTFTGGTVSGATNFISGLTASTISATTYQNLPSNIINVTYNELVDNITGSTLESGKYYLIINFRTFYDQPDFDYNGNPITSNNYKPSDTRPLLVFATSESTISQDAYQPDYPNDKIKYDWTYSQTEVSGGLALGRITERIDEFNNRTDYDHRNILFKRYRLFTHREGLRQNGTIDLQNDGTVTGTDTRFDLLSEGDVIYIPNINPSYFLIKIINSPTSMSVQGDIINSGSGLIFYKTIEETNGTGYFSFKQTNVYSDDFAEYTTFGDALSNSYAKNNYIGNYANNYQNAGSGTFLLSNNVFLEGQYESNKFGDYCYNNTFGTDNQNNVWGDYCYENVSTNDIDDNFIGHYFYRNLLNVNLINNQIGNYFYNNQLLAENNDSFDSNIIGNNFNNNTIYSWFYKNEILDEFNNNIIGDFGNLTYFAFYRNYIRNNFNNNTIRQTFQNNQIGTNYQNNTINGEFVGNTILNGFNNNETGNYFGVNNIGNGFNGNTINDDFYYNSTDYYFNSNTISNTFTYNNIDTYFTNNVPSNNNLFGWNNLNTVLSRTFNTFFNATGNNLNVLLGKEFIMRINSTSQYFKLKFTQWTADFNGGGFQYERQEIDSSGNNIGQLFTFTRSNYSSEIDVVVPGILEISRSDVGGIYNVVSELSWDGNISPSGTSWNSIYTQANNGERFSYNKIGNNFRNNIIGSDFGYGGFQAYGNIINDNFENNTIGQFMYNNVIGNYFTFNTVGDNFEDNTIKNYFIGNTIGDGFESNTIGNYFGQNGGNIENTIINDFKFNKIGNYFGNDGTNTDGGNVINNGFQNNTIGDNFYFNACDENFSNNVIGNSFIFNTILTGFSDNQIGNVYVTNDLGNNFSSNKIGNYFAFSTIGNSFQKNVVGDFFGNANGDNQIGDDFTNNQIGNNFGNDGTNNFGGNTVGSGFTKNLITSTQVYGYDFTMSTYVYDSNMNKNIFDRQDGTPRLSYYDNSDVLNITNIDN